MSATAANVEDQRARNVPHNNPAPARVLAVFLPISAGLLMLGEVLTPKGLDKPTTTLGAVLKTLPIAAAHSSQLYFSNLLVIFGLGTLAVSFAGIATLARERDVALSIAAALIGGTAAFCGALANTLVGFNTAAGATAHTTPAAAAQVLLSANTSAVSKTLLVVYLGGGLLAILLTGIALWRTKTVARWLPVLFGLGLVVAASSRPGLIAVPLQLPFAVAMIVLAARIWNNAQSTTTPSSASHQQ
jgi:hypothetical protein